MQNPLEQRAEGSKANLISHSVFKKKINRQYMLYRDTIPVLSKSTAGQVL